MIRLVSRLALQDARHDARLFFCFALALAAILAPIMILLALKHGVVEALRRDLLENPRISEVSSIGNHNFDPAFLAALRARPDVAFVVPRTRSISATVFVSNPDRGAETVTAELVATAPGDPILGGLPPAQGKGRVLVSAPLAEKLGIRPGRPLQLAVVRTVEGKRERLALTPEVVAAAPLSAFPRDAVFAEVELLEAVEDFLDGVAGQRRSYAGFRLHARSLEAVAPIAAALSARRVDTATRAEEIETVLALDRNLSLIFVILASIGGLGFAVSFGASLWANVERKRRQLSLLRLLGIPKRAMIVLPAVQALLIAGFGIAVATAVAGGSQLLINAVYRRGPGAVAQVSDLTPLHVAVLAGATLLLALVATALAGLRAAAVDPAEGARDE